MSKVMHYVCASCGLYFTREPASMMGCPNGECQSPRVWEFTRKDNALHHARHIQSGIRTGLFRRSA